MDSRGVGLTVHTVAGTDLVMQNIGNKLARGSELTNIEHLIPISVAAHDANTRLMPDLTQPVHQELPEVAKGAIANHMG